ncbi:MAG: hypothetical protein QOE36_573 [Gaiellaceae bacterium]|jgi:hypothetical protein|nr:hypothetical protein [Gaiellaceae bacterium]
MDLRIRPEPTPEERRAIELALTRAAADPGPDPLQSRWRAAAIRENVGAETSREDQATARPRSSPGATRA